MEEPLLSNVNQSLDQNGGGTGAERSRNRNGAGMERGRNGSGTGGWTRSGTGMGRVESAALKRAANESVEALGPGPS